MKRPVLVMLTLVSAIMLTSCAPAKSGFTACEDGATRYYSEGEALTGWQTISDKRYHFGEDGIMAVDINIEGYRIDSEGVAVQGAVPPSAATGKKSGLERLDKEVKTVLDSIADDNMTDPEKLKVAYNWIVNKLRYKFITVDVSQGYTEELIYELAEYSVLYRNGSCEYYAALLYVCFERMGFDVMMVEGTRLDSKNNTWGDHVWVIAEVDGKTYNFDPLFGRNHTSNALSMFMVKDSALEATHNWDREKYPACK